MNGLCRIVRLRRREGAPAFLFFAYLTLIVTAYIVSKSIRDALFLYQFHAYGLPYVYVGVAIIVAFIVTVYVRLSTRFDQIRLIKATLFFFMITALLLWWALRINWDASGLVYYMWANALGIILTAQVWTLVTSVLNVDQAKRMLPFICSGGILGSILGGAIAAGGVKALGADQLTLAPIALLGLSLPIVQILGRRYGPHRRNSQLRTVEPAEHNDSVRSVLKVTMRVRYLRLIALLLSLSAIVTLIIDFQFKMVVQEEFQSKDAMAVFFGSFYAYVGLCSFALQFFAASRIFERYGLKLALLFLPMTLLGGTAALLAYPSVLWATVFLKGSDGVLRPSIDRSTIEMLYVPVPQSLKVQVKAVIDMLIQRFSDGVGGILLLVLTHLFGLGLFGVGMVNVVLLTAWIWIARETRHEYVRNSLEEDTLAISSLPEREVS